MGLKATILPNSIDGAPRPNSSYADIRLLSCEPLIGPIPDLNLDGAHWVIVGGESSNPTEPDSTVSQEPVVYSGPSHQPTRRAF